MRSPRPSRPTARPLALPGLAVAALLLSAGAALASPFSITSTGTIVSGTDPGNLLGAGASLAGDAYTLTVNYSGVGPTYYTDGSGGFASVTGGAVPGSITLTIGQHTTTTALSANLGTTIVEDPYDLDAVESGNSATGAFASAEQNLSANVAFAVADLQTGFSYALAAGDTGTDTFKLVNPANTLTASFSGTESSVRLTLAAAVPEPATWAVLGVGLLGLARTRRRGAA